MSGRLALGAVLVGAGALWLLSSAEVVSLSYGAWIGVLLVALGIATALARSDVFSGGIGEREERPRTRADLEEFRHGIGKLTVDLTASRLDIDNELVVASVGVGELVVLVPDDAGGDLEARVGAGNVEAFGETENGVDVSFDRLSGTSGTRELDLELEVGFGNLRVVGPSRGPG
jgi:predicted membrane protein